MAAQRVIFHCDCNSFYASVELLTRPELKNVPVAVCGNPQHRHGIILAKNEAAKKYGIQTAETVASARRKCPQLALLSPHHELYRAYSKQVNAIYARYTEFVEPFGIDESWLDMTASWHLFGPSPVAVAHRIRREVKAQTGLTISVGVSFTKAFAKLGSDYKKPDAVTEFSLENYRQLVWPLPVEALLYVGHSARQTLGKLGITTIGQLAAASPQVLEAALGKLGMELWGFARGEEGSPVRSMYEKREVKSVGNGLTFPRDLTTLADARAGLVALSDEVASRLRAHGLYAGAVQITVKDAGFKTITRQAQLATPTPPRQGHCRSRFDAFAAELAFSRTHPHADRDGPERFAQRRGPAFAVRTGGRPGGCAAGKPRKKPGFHPGKIWQKRHCLCQRAARRHGPWRLENKREAKKRRMRDMVTHIVLWNLKDKTQKASRAQQGGEMKRRRKRWWALCPGFPAPRWAWASTDLTWALCARWTAAKRWTPISATPRTWQ